MNYFQFHIGDYEKDAGHLSLIEEGVYFRLLKRYYATQRPIPDTDKYRVARASTPTERTAVNGVLGEFFKREGDAWRHSYAEREIERAKRKIESNRANGFAGGRPVKASRDATVPHGTKPTGLGLGSPPKPTGLPLGSQNESQNNPHGFSPEASKPINQEKEIKDNNNPRSAAPPVGLFALPDFVSQTAWDAFLEMRREKKKRPTQRAVELLLRKLTRLHNAGNDANAVLDASTVNGWTDVFKLRPDDIPAPLAAKNYSAGVQADGSF